MPDLQAAIGRVQLSRQSEFERIRLGVAKRYVDGLKDMNPPMKYQMNCLHPHHARHLFLLQLPLEKMRLDRDEVLLALRARNIGATIHYDPLHLMPLYYGNMKPESLPATEIATKSIITLPISASMTIADADYVVEHLRAIIE